VVRVVFAGSLIALALFAQQQPPPEKKNPAQAKQQEVEPPEEDESLLPEQCVLNPLEASRNITAGNFYYKKGNFRAAANRYKRATCWDPSSAEAFLKLGEAEEKMKDRDAALDAYQKYLALAPDAKNSPEVKKKIAKFQEKK
jgi:tetratricopeptide (TPR) repeat protein